MTGQDRKRNKKRYRNRTGQNRNKEQTGQDGSRTREDEKDRTDQARTSI